MAISSKPKVSVVVPVYNGEKYLRQCLDAILAQTLQDIEVICVDDGSSDQSLAILHEYKEMDTRVRVLSQPHSNAGVARNRGIDEAHGEFLSFLDNDDFFDPTMLEKAYQQCVIDDAEICVFGVNLFDCLNGETMPCNYSLRLDLLPEDRPFAGFDIVGNPFKVFVAWPWDKLFRRSFILNRRIRFQEQRSTNDILFVLTAILKASRITTVDERLVTQRLNVPGSITATREKSWQCAYAALKALRNETMRMGVFARYERDFVNYALHHLVWQVRTIAETSAGEAMIRAMKDEWFQELGILGHTEQYFENKVEFAAYEIIMAEAEGGYWRLLYYLLERHIVELCNSPPRVVYLEREAQAIRQSISYKVGRAVTWLPRWVKRLHERHINQFLRAGL